jgi:endonuclease-8
VISAILSSTQRQAASLRVALIGKEVRAATIAQDVVLSLKIGSAIEEVRAFGREIEIVFDDGLVLRSKMGLRGTWKIFYIADWQRKKRGPAKALIQVENLIAVCFGPSEIETHHDFDPRRHPLLGRNGPDLSDQKTDLDLCVDLMVDYQDADATIAEVLLDQRVLRGIGNVFRCELLWTCELHPWAKVSSLNRDECRELVSIAAEMLQSQHTPHARALAVYGRHGKNCERCNGQIRVTHHGEANRVLYWCADCQNRHAGTSSSRYVTEHDTPPGVHPAEFIYLSELEQARKSG